MGLEIERKYLVKGPFKSHAYKSFNIKQGYLSEEAEKTVRIRIRDKQGFITIKGIQKGITRYEWEKEIDLADAEELLLLCQPGNIEKRRYLVRSGNHTIEVDEFFGKNRGLVLAEIELQREDEEVALPDWIGDEVSFDMRYHNSNLSRSPFCEWTNEV